MIARLSAYFSFDYDVPLSRQSKGGPPRWSDADEERIREEEKRQKHSEGGPWNWNDVLCDRGLVMANVVKKKTESMRHRGTLRQNTRHKRPGWSRRAQARSS